MCFYDMCMYASEYKKPTKLLTTIKCLDKLGVLCDGQHQHDRQSGQVKQAPPFKPCIKIQNHNDLRRFVSPRVRPDRARC